MTEVTKTQNFPPIDGGSVEFDNVGSSGFSINVAGLGSLSLDLRRSDGEWRYIDLGNIGFADIAEGGFFQDRAKSDMSGIKRRLSKKQADLVVKVITKAMSDTFKGVIPSDDDIDNFKL